MTNIARSLPKYLKIYLYLLTDLS